MTRWVVLGDRMLPALVELTLALACAVFAVVSWRNGLITTTFAPAGDVPGFDATRYSAPWLVLAAFLVVVAGALAIDAVARTVRAVRSH
ncbi:hypothetical protein OG874_31130 [Nocardia sp. NBC_00565]|uniref:hypothetical protein n=1 Tax=Nocardia sp. NBC_00565 TaxID=2975993 RepID=UPI002E801CCF|nr:hypothetical protein [Nocardia sp. NBC_00565]WUC01235.1 hypothetical protein OG874_31130 [Nocardia sp. NBC_00565]